jgi:hypothetical protein
MPPQPLHESTHVRLRRPHQQPIPHLNVLGKLLQIPLIRLTTRRPKPFLYAQIRNKLPHNSNIPRSLSRILHRPIIRALRPEKASTINPVPT